MAASLHAPLSPQAPSLPVPSPANAAPAKSKFLSAKPTQKSLFALCLAAAGCVMAASDKMPGDKLVNDIVEGDKIVLYNKKNWLDESGPASTENPYEALTLAPINKYSLGKFVVAYQKGVRADGRSIFEAPNFQENLVKSGVCQIDMTSDTAGLEEIQLMDNLKSQQLTIALKGDVSFLPTARNDLQTRVTFPIEPRKVKGGTVVGFSCVFNMPWRKAMDTLLVSDLKKVFNYHADFINKATSPPPSPPVPRPAKAAPAKGVPPK